MSSSPLLYRRQFLLAPRGVDSPIDRWQQTPIAGGRRLHTHPDLLVTQRERGGVELTLVGFAIDPDHPRRDDGAILDDLLGGVRAGEDVLAQTDSLGGRWVLVVADPVGTFVFQDASGLRQLVHTRRQDGMWCASQPELLKRAVPLEVDPTVSTFTASRFYQKSREAWWPGDRTRYRDVRALLPNHALDLQTGAVRRFWPYAPLEPRSLEGAVDHGTAILRGMMLGARHRFPLTIAMTAGLDSRLQLAASRDIAHDATFFTHLHYGHGEGHVDAVVPRKLLKRLGLRLQVVECPTPKTFADSAEPSMAAYRELYLANTSTAHVGWGSISYAMRAAVPDDHVVVKANCNETTRHRFRVRSGDAGTDPATLARTMTGLFGMDGADFATEEFRRWADRSVGPIEALGYDAYDLAFWEQRSGRWQAGDQLERDLDHETFVPFNSREYFACLLGVPAEHRTAPERLHLEMIQALWPETLRIPINPLPLRAKVRAAARSAFVATDTLDVAKRIARRAWWT